MKIEKKKMIDQYRRIQFILAKINDDINESLEAREVTSYLLTQIDDEISFWDLENVEEE